MLPCQVQRGGTGVSALWSWWDGSALTCHITTTTTPSFCFSFTCLPHRIPKQPHSLLNVDQGLQEIGSDMFHPGHVAYCTYPGLNSDDKRSNSVNGTTAKLVSRLQVSWSGILEKATDWPISLTHAGHSWHGNEPVPAFPSPPPGPARCPLATVLHGQLWPVRVSQSFPAPKIFQATSWLH